MATTVHFNNSTSNKDVVKSTTTNKAMHRKHIKHKTLTYKGDGPC